MVVAHWRLQEGQTDRHITIWNLISESVVLDKLPVMEGREVGRRGEGILTAGPAFASVVGEGSRSESVRRGDLWEGTLALDTCLPCPSSSGLQCQLGHLELGHLVSELSN